MSGVCGKKAPTAKLQDRLTGALVSLSGLLGEKASEETMRLIAEGLFATVTNVSFDDDAIKAEIEKVSREASKLNPGCACCGGWAKPASSDRGSAAAINARLPSRITEKTALLNRNAGFL
jgi:hydroxylamine reductase (hybrid-cluster protein)